MNGKINVNQVNAEWVKMLYPSLIIWAFWHWVRKPYILPCRTPWKARRKPRIRQNIALLPNCVSACRCFEPLSRTCLRFVPRFGARTWIPAGIYHTSSSAQATITKWHRWGGLNNRDLFFTVLDDGKSKVKVQPDSFRGEVSLPGLQMADSLLCPHMTFLQYCARIGRERERQSPCFLPLLVKPLIPRHLGGSVCWTSNFSAGHDLTVCEFEPHMRLLTDSRELAWDFSLPLSLCPLPGLCSLSLKK